MTGCLLVGASYALLNTQTHAVGAVAAVGVEDSKVRDLLSGYRGMPFESFVPRISEVDGFPQRSASSCGKQSPPGAGQQMPQKLKIQKCTVRFRYHGRVYSRSQWQRRFRKPCRKIGLLLERVDSEVVDLVFAMEDMERGLQEMAQSVEHMQEMLKRSPMVQALAQRKPEVRAPSGFFPQEGSTVCIPDEANRAWSTCR